MDSFHIFLVVICFLQWVTILACLAIMGVLTKVSDIILALDMGGEGE